MLGVRLPDDLDKRLGMLAKSTHRTKSYYVKEAIETYLDEYEQMYQAISQYEESKKNNTLKLHSMEDLMQDLGIEDRDVDA